MSPFKKSTVKGSNSKGKELVIDLSSFSPKSKKTQSSTGVFYDTWLRSYTAYQAYLSYFKNAPMVIERIVEQATLRDTNIPKWFTSKDWNYLLTNLEDPYEEHVEEFYANAIFDGEELRCWVRWKEFTITPSHFALILNINRPMFVKPPVYDDMDPDPKIFYDVFGENLDVSSNGKSIGLSSLSPELRLLTTVMFHNLYALSRTENMNLVRALFLHDLITDEEIDVCSHIFQILVKIAERMASRNCPPFCCLITKKLKLRGVPTLEDEYPQPKQRPINITTQCYNRPNPIECQARE